MGRLPGAKGGAEGSEFALKSPRRQRFYRPELDVLRFLASFAVFIYHVPPGSLYFYLQHGALGTLGAAGCFGVDLFFTLSGYLITTLLLRERETTGRIDVRAFYVRRFLRIWPLYFFFMAFAFCVSQLPVTLSPAPPFLTTHHQDVSAGCFLRMAFFVANFGTCFLIPLAGHLWTISIEEQFYLVWPLILSRLPIRRITFVPPLMFTVAIIMRLLSPVLHLHVLVWNNTLTRLDPIAMGILIALLPEIMLSLASRAVIVLAGVGCWLFAAGYCGLPLPGSAVGTALGYPAVALGSGALLIATLNAGSQGTGGTAKRVLIYLGSISYGLYVYSLIAILAARALMYLPALGWFRRVDLPFWMPWSCYLILAFGTNVLLAAASYRWIEAPFLRLKDRFTTIRSRDVSQG